MSKRINEENVLRESINTSESNNIFLSIANNRIVNSDILNNPWIEYSEKNKKQT